MLISRRNTLSLVAATLIAPAAWADDSPEAQRSIGSPTAPVTAIEYFSLTCPHCAEFGTVTMPQVKPNLVDTGKLQIIYHDYPLDAIALMAAQIARYLPAAQYYPFIEALFASQEQWAFVPVTDPNNPPDYKSLIYPYAALAGMDQATFNTAIADDKLKNFILQGQQEAETLYHIDATPTFIINGTTYPGAMEYDQFANVINTAATQAAK
jgi:protein-disulfide isomerase